MYAIVGAVVVIVIIVAALYLAGVFSPGTSTPGTPATIYGNGTYANCPPSCGYTPNPLTITHGTKVTWTNNATSTPHTVTECVSASDPAYCPSKDASALSPVFDSGTAGLNSGQSYSYTFASAGTYYYYCRFHPQMHGNLTVT